MTSPVQRMVRSIDSVVARIYLALCRERNAVISFLFHSLFKSEKEIAQKLVDPLERTTVAQFRQFVRYFLQHGYRFISPDDLLGSLDPRGKYALITFDDGYFNNSLALGVLEEFGVPAIFFISTEHVRLNKSFWWDVLYRERSAQGASERQIYREALALKSLRTHEIESRLIERFGPAALTPRGDIDRPFTPAELRDFAQSSHVHLGNHTADHAILTNYDLPEAEAQIRGAQETLREMTGVTAMSIAYPNGAHNPRLVRMCREIGLKVGFTIRPAKIGLPLNDGSPSLLQLGRFVPHADSPMATQCRTFRSDFQLYGKFRAGYLRLVRGQAAQ